MTGCELDAALRTLHPGLRERAAEHIARTERAGFEVRELIAWESIERREELWRRGRALEAGAWRVRDPALIVTHSRLGWHPFGFAYDLDVTREGKPLRSARAWSRVGELGRTLGLDWHGDSSAQWNNRHHFQWPMGAAGVWPKDAAKLFRQHGSLEALWRELERRVPELRGVAA